MSNKPLSVLQHSYAVMVNDDTDYQSIDINEDTMLVEENYEHVIVDGQGVSNFDSYQNNDNELVQEVFDTDLPIEGTNSIWRHNTIRYLIYCWSQLRDQFSKYPDKKKNALWQIVSERMVERGLYFDALQCQRKWRCLKKVYLFNKTKLANQGNSKNMNIWPHYHDMDRAIKGISYDISDIFNDNYNDSKECTIDSRIITIEDDIDNTNSIYGNNYQWTNISTRELLQLYSKQRSKFMAVNQGGKHLLWEEIALQMQQLGYQYSADSCNDKWRNLKMTYKKNKQRAMKYGIQHVKWIYFKEIENILKTPSTNESTDHGNIITVSLNDANELVNINKELDENHLEDSVDFQTTDVNVIEKKDNNDDDGTLSNVMSEIWTEAATKCLIDLWGMYRSRFMLAPQGKKRLLWNEISTQLRKNGHNYSGLVCDRKWRLLKANYFKRKEKHKKFGMGTVRWQYYHDLDRLLGSPAETVSWSMDSTMCLIDCFDHHKDKFMKAATGGKLLIWKQIAAEMLQHGFNYSSRACDNKWRTLKNRFNKNKMRANRKKKVVWVYYSKIESVLKELNKQTSNDQETNNIDTENNDLNENSDLEEHNYIKTMKPEFSIKPETIAEIKDIFTTRNTEFDQRLKEMENNLNSREKVFERLQKQTLEALNKSNELEIQKLKLLEQIVSRLPHHT